MHPPGRPHHADPPPSSSALHHNTRLAQDQQEAGLGSSAAGRQPPIRGECVRRVIKAAFWQAAAAPISPPPLLTTPSQPLSSPPPLNQPTHPPKGPRRPVHPRGPGLHRRRRARRLPAPGQPRPQIRRGVPGQRAHRDAGRAAGAAAVGAGRVRVGGGGCVGGVAAVCLCPGSGPGLRLSFNFPTNQPSQPPPCSLAPLFDGMAVDGGRAVGLNSNIRIYRYTKSQKFGKHIDDSVSDGSVCTGARQSLVRQRLWLACKPSNRPLRPADKRAHPRLARAPRNRLSWVPGCALATPCSYTCQAQTPAAAAAAAVGARRRPSSRRRPAAGPSARVPAARCSCRGKEAQRRPSSAQARSNRCRAVKPSSTVSRSLCGAVGSGCAAFSYVYNHGIPTFPCAIQSPTGDRGRVVASVAPRPGLALLHLHGEDRCMEHEGAAVAGGTKYVLRSDVVFSSDAAV
jgi:hypothetical protein